MGRTDINLNARNRLMFKWYGNDRTERKGNLFDNIGTGAILPRLQLGCDGRLRPHPQLDDDHQQPLRVDPVLGP